MCLGVPKIPPGLLLSDASCMLQGPQLYRPVVQTLTAQLGLVFAPSQAGAGGAMEGLLEMDQVLQGSFLQPQLKRFHEELSDAALDAGLQVHEAQCMNLKQQPWHKQWLSHLSGSLLELDQVLQGRFLRPQLERFHEELSDVALAAGLQVRPGSCPGISSGLIVCQRVCWRWTRCCRAASCGPSRSAVMKSSQMWLLLPVCRSQTTALCMHDVVSHA